jgi:cytoskeletal protein CcmA (bactofilin family)
MRPVSRLRTTKAHRAAAIAAAAVLAFLAAHASEEAPEQAAEASYVLQEGETNTGNLRLFRSSAEIAGVQRGRLSFVGGTLRVTGTVDGEVSFIGQSASLEGTVRKGATLRGAEAVILGSVDGDVNFTGATLRVGPDARIRGSLTARGSRLVLEGVVDGKLDAYVGEVELSGRIKGDALVRSDVLDLREGYAIGGKFDYVARNELPAEALSGVAGKVSYGGRAIRPSGGGVVHKRSAGLHFVWFLGTYLLGLTATALARVSLPRVTEAVRHDGLRSAGVGFLAFFIVPVAAALSMIFIVTIPLALLVLVAWILAILLAAVPVALLVGQWLLARLGRSASHPALELLVGLIPLSLVFAIPAAGRILWIGVVWLGLGAIVLGGVTRWQEVRATRAAAAGSGAA